MWRVLRRPCSARGLYDSYGDVALSAQLEASHVESQTEVFSRRESGAAA